MVGTKIQSYNKDGYYISNACGVIAKHLGGGHAIIKSNDGFHYSTVGIRGIVEIEILGRA